MANHGVTLIDAAGEGVEGKKNANGERVNVLRVLMVASNEDTVERCSKETRAAALRMWQYVVPTFSTRRSLGEGG
jgi:hypothetical protein